MSHSTKSKASLILERDAEKAANEIRASLGLWTSPKLGTVAMEPPTPMSLRKKSERYHDDDNNNISIDDSNAWENNDDEDDEFMDAVLLHTPENDTSITPMTTDTTTASKRTKITHRSNTPIMSNHSKKRGSIVPQNKNTTTGSSSSIVGRNATIRTNPEDGEEEADTEVPYNINSPWVNASYYKSHRTPKD
jgi:hypothetical protein